MHQLVVNFVSYSHLITFTIAYFLLDQLYHKSKLNYLFVFLILFFTILFIRHVSLIDSLLLYILFFFLSIWNAGIKSVSHSLLLVSLSYIIEIIISEISRSWYFEAIIIENIIEKSLMFLFATVVTISLVTAICWSIRKWLLPFIKKKQKESLVSCLLAILLICYQTYHLVTMYTDQFPFLANLFITLYLILLVLIIAIVHTSSKNEKLRLQAQKQKLEYEMMSTYATEVKKQYAEMRKFRHDYVNILATFEYYLDQNNLDELKQFYQSNVKKTKTLFSTNMLRLDDLQRIESLEIRSIFTTKLIAAQGKNIDVQIEVSETIPDQQLVDPIIFIRILGILLDNAIEELETLGEGKLLVAVFLKNGDTIFIIQNTAREQIEPVYLLKQADFSTKGDGRGLGLANVDELVALEPRMFLETSITNGCFTQKITITGG